MAVAIKKEGLPKGISWREDRKCYLGRVTYQGQPHVRYGDSWKRLNVRLEELRAELKKGTYIKECTLTLNEWFGKWMEIYKKKTVKYGTYNNYLNHYNYYVKGGIGKKKLKDVTVDDIQTLYNNLCDRDFAAGTIKLMGATLNGCFKKAVNNRMITFKPVPLAEIQSARRRRKNMSLQKTNRTSLWNTSKKAICMIYSVLS